MYTAPRSPLPTGLLAAGSALAVMLLLTGCASKRGGGSTAQSDEALYLFDDGTGDLPSASDYAANDNGQDLDFTSSEQIASQPEPEPERKSRRSRGRDREEPQQQAVQPAPQYAEYIQNPGPGAGAAGGTQYYNEPAQSPAPSQYGPNGPGPANYAANATSDVISTPPAPVTSGGTGAGAGANTGSSGTGSSSSSSTKKKSSTASSSKASTRTYVVKRGDTLSEIATRNGTTVTAIKNLNGLSSNTIQVGQKLKVSGKGGATATATSSKKKSSSKPRTHTVKSGDNLWDISQKYGVSVTSLKNANNLASSSLQPGQKLRLP